MSWEAWGTPDDSPFEPAIEAGWIDPTDVSKATIDVMNERDRQVNEEGWSAEHDDQHERGELAAAAACYAQFASRSDATRKGLIYSGLYTRLRIIQEFWPFDRSWWKPKDRRRDLVRAGALIIAEIERLDRVAERSK